MPPALLTYPVSVALAAHSCGAPAKLQCPKCLDLKLPKDVSVFCTQDCFKVSTGTTMSCADLRVYTSMWAAHVAHTPVQAKGRPFVTMPSDKAIL